MNVYFNLNLTSNCTLQISDLTQKHNEYLPEDSNSYVTPGRFKYTDTYTINVIKSVESLNTNIVNTIITLHINNEGTPLFYDETYYHLLKDGHYVIDHIILPSVKCVENNVNAQLYDYIYATDGVSFFKLVEKKFEKCSIEELLEINSNLKTTISKASQDVFSICFLHKCYLNLCKTNFNKLTNERCVKKTDIDPILDLIWVGLNAIRYNVEFGYLENAQSILEDLTRCTNICNNHKIYQNDCGCCK